MQRRGTSTRLGAILLHGRGSSARDILGLASALGLSDIAYIAPEAPGNSWWPTSFLAPHAQMAPWLDRGVAAIDQAVATLEADGFRKDRIAILGFSQGACLALDYAARRPGLHSAIGLSGGLVGTGDADGTPTEALYGHIDKRFDYGTDLTGLDVFIGCHEQDPHIPLARVHRSAEVLTTLGAKVQTDILPGPGHGIVPSEIDAVQNLWISG
ncbi:alpha/beta hydrolase [Aestuariibius sp. 2305UL40-4]|uniref:alpha/beta hydrolase n=1 Tax=Aestuariibius violaceus TaxID=3234132 RepID=UPI00345F08C2